MCCTAVCLLDLLPNARAPCADVCNHSGWAVAASLHIDPADHSALNDMHWLSGGSSGGSSGSGQESSMCLSGLLAKAMSAPAVTLAAQALGSELLYAVEWQAHSSSHISSAPGTRVADAAAPLWQLGGNTVKVAGQQRSGSDAAFAAAHLAAMQAVSGSVVQMFLAVVHAVLWLSNGAPLLVQFSDPRTPTPL